MLANAYKKQVNLIKRTYRCLNLATKERRKVSQSILTLFLYHQSTDFAWKAPFAFALGIAYGFSLTRMRTLKNTVWYNSCPLFQPCGRILPAPIRLPYSCDAFKRCSEGTYSSADHFQSCLSRRCTGMYSGSGSSSAVLYCKKAKVGQSLL